MSKLKILRTSQRMDKKTSAFELMQAREKMGDRRVMTDPEKVENLRKGIAWGIFYCPPEHQVMWESALNEVFMREMYVMGLKPWNDNKPPD